MKEFPATFIPTNWKTFAATDLNRNQQYLREAIYEHFLKVRQAKIVTKEEKFADKPINLSTIELSNSAMLPFEDPFSLADFRKKRDIRLDEFAGLVKVAEQELKAKGWNTYVDKENSGLWIWPSELDKPKSIPEF